MLGQAETRPTTIDVLFPASELEIGRKAFAERLAQDDDFRVRMNAALLAHMDEVGFGDLGYARIARLRSRR